MKAKKVPMDLTPEAIELVANRFRVLAEPLRLRILNVLQAGERNVSDLANELGSTQPNVSKHLRVLQEAGFIGRRQEGNSVFCYVADDFVFDLCDVVRTSLLSRMAAQARMLEPATKPRRK